MVSTAPQLKPNKFASWNMVFMICKSWLCSWITHFLHLAMVIEENGNVNLGIFCSTTLPLCTGLLLFRWGCREHFVSGCWHSSGRDRGRHSRKCWLSTLGVLHPGVPVMWYGHIRDLFTTAEGCMGSRTPNVTRLHWAQQEECYGVM